MPTERRSRTPRSAAVSAEDQPQRPRISARNRWNPSRPRRSTCCGWCAAHTAALREKSSRAGRVLPWHRRANPPAADLSRSIPLPQIPLPNSAAPTNRCVPPSTLGVGRARVGHPHRLLPSLRSFLSLRCKRISPTEWLRLSRNDSVRATGARPSGRRDARPQRPRHTLPTRPPTHYQVSSIKRFRNSLALSKTRASAA